MLATNPRQTFPASFERFRVEQMLKIKGVLVPFNEERLAGVGLQIKTAVLIGCVFSSKAKGLAAKVKEIGAGPGAVLLVVDQATVSRPSNVCWVPLRAPAFISFTKDCM